MAKRTIGRVTVPKDADSLLKLASTVYAKHTEEGAASFLNSLDDYKWSEIGVTVQKTLDLHRQAEEFKKKAEECYRERDKYLPNIESVVRSSKSLLKAIYTKNPKKLGEWGFVIDDSPKIKNNTTPPPNE